MIFSKSADIHPVAILFIIMIGAQVAGILGMLVAIPIATVLKITINQISWSLSNYHIFRTSGGNVKQSDSFYFTEKRIFSNKPLRISVSLRLIIQNKR